MDYNNELIKLKNMLDNDKQKQIELILKSNKSEYVKHYSILTVALNDKLLQIDNEDLKHFYDMKTDCELKGLTEVDYLLVRIVKTLSAETNRNIKKEFYDNFVLNSEQPELKFLTQLTIELISL